MCEVFSKYLGFTVLNAQQMITIFTIIIVFVIDSHIKSQEWLNCQVTQAPNAGG